MEAEVSKAFKEEQGLSVSRRILARRRKPRERGRRGHLGKEPAAISSGFALLVVDAPAGPGEQFCCPKHSLVLLRKPLLSASQFLTSP